MSCADNDTQTLFAAHRCLYVVECTSHDGQVALDDVLGLLVEIETICPYVGMYASFVKVTLDHLEE